MIRRILNALHLGPSTYCPKCGWWMDGCRHQT